MVFEIKTHYPNTLTIWDEQCDLPDQCQIALVDGVEEHRWTQPQSIKAFAQSPTARRRFQKQWGVEGMKAMQTYSDATIWDSVSIPGLTPQFPMILSIQWFALIPNHNLETFVFDKGIEVC